MRAFIAVELDDDVRAAVARVVRTLREGPSGESVRWAQPENLHVTVRFLGDVARERIPAIVREVGAAAAGVPPFFVELGRVGAFPSARRPRVIALAIAPEKPLQQLAAAVEAAVVRAGVESDRHRFRPHLTLGRLRGRELPPVTAPVTAEGETMAVNEIVLFSSELTRRGALHTPLERMALGGLDHP
jgi:2'-5' RNA ligase